MDRIMTLALTINGEARTVANSATVEELLAELHLDPRAVVVELNRKIIRRAAIAAAPVADGDVVEIVHFVGGG
jgi:thiamine biosynthesis protein ThiS